MKILVYYLLFLVLAMPMLLVCCEGSLFLQVLGVVYSCWYVDSIIKILKRYEAKQDNANEE